MVDDGIIAASTLESANEIMSTDEIITADKTIEILDDEFIVIKVESCTEVVIRR